MAAPQFGVPEAGFFYPDRLAAFAVVEREGLIALVLVRDTIFGDVLDLPGGGVDPDETLRAAATRETGEEAGLRVELDLEPFVRADHFSTSYARERRNTRGSFFAGRFLAEAPELRIENDHELTWRRPSDAIMGLDRESHAWAVAAWLRLRARG